MQVTTTREDHVRRSESDGGEVAITGILLLDGNETSRFARIQPLTLPFVPTH